MRLQTNTEMQTQYNYVALGPHSSFFTDMWNWIECCKFFLTSTSWGLKCFSLHLDCWSYSLLSYFLCWNHADIISA